MRSSRAAAAGRIGLTVGEKPELDEQGYKPLGAVLIIDETGDTKTLLRARRTGLTILCPMGMDIPNTEREMVTPICAEGVGHRLRYVRVRFA